MSRCVRLAVVFVLTIASVALSQNQPFHGQIEVRRIVTQVRVVTADGSPVLGLGPADFRVTVGGDPAEVEAVDWVTESTLPAETEPAAGVSLIETTPALPMPRGRLLVLLFQTDLRPSRLTGLVRIDHHVINLVRSLAPEDRVAVAVVGSHLELHADFTDEFERLGQQLTAIEVLRPGSVVDDGRHPSLARNFDEHKARAATTLSQSLEVIGEALEPIDGTKSVVLIGWGAGRYQGGLRPVYLGSDYDRAIEALAAADTSVFSLDVTQSDRHSLAQGLQRFADDTGGLYVRSYLTPELSVKKLGRVLSGHYELSLVPPDTMRKREFRLRVRVDLPGVEVLARGLEVRDP